MENSVIYSKLSLKDSYFDHKSNLHGPDHTYRVMVHAHNISISLLRQDLLFAVLGAAFVHDMARQHDGYCTEHGLWAVEKKVPLFITLFNDMGITDRELVLIKKAIENHSLMEELREDHPAYLITSILKDADALDRVRLGDNNLDQRFLRFSDSMKFIEFARSLYLSSSNVKFHNFTEILSLAKLINQKKRPW